MDLRDYQKKNVEALYSILCENFSALLADEMGLGKSLQAMATIDKLISESIIIESILIVCPASLCLNWHAELEKWASQEIIDITRVVSYNWAVKHCDTIENVDFLVLDEAHYLKNRGSLRSEACLNNLWEKSVSKLLMTGTPCPNGIMDGWSLFNKLNPEMFPNKYKYGWRYCNAKPNWYTGGHDFVGFNKKRLPELRAKLATFMVRNRKREVLPELPPKTYQTLPVDIEKPGDYCLSEVETQRALAAICEGPVATKRRALGMCKVKALIRIVETIMAEKRRIVVFTYHQDVSDETIKALKPVKCTPLQITGKTPMKTRHALVERFQSNKQEKLVLVAQIEAAGVGINLTKSDTCIFLEQDWVPARMAQAIDRLHRIGQESNVQVIYLVAKGTLDTQIIRSLREKIEAITEAVR